MSKKGLSVKAEILDMESFAKRIGAAFPEAEHMHNPRTFNILTHPFTSVILEVFPEFEKVLGIIRGREEIRRWSGMDAEQKAFDLSIAAAAREVNLREESEESAKPED